jgi:hypothetical protein
VCGGADAHCGDPYNLSLAFACRTDRVAVAWAAPSRHPPLRVAVASRRGPCRLDWTVGKVGV